MIVLTDKAEFQFEINLFRTHAEHVHRTAALIELIKLHLNICKHTSTVTQTISHFSYINSISIFMPFLTQ